MPATRAAGSCSALRRSVVGSPPWGLPQPPVDGGLPQDRVAAQPRRLPAPGSPPGQGGAFSAQRGVLAVARVEPGVVG